MKDSKRRMMAILKIFDPELFYSISISKFGQVQLQGAFNNEVVIEAQRNKFIISVNPSGYVSFKRGYYEITLT